MHPPACFSPPPFPRAGNVWYARRARRRGVGLLTEAAPRENVDALANLPSLLAETRANRSVAVEDLKTHTHPPRHDRPDRTGGTGIGIVIGLIGFRRAH